MSIIGKRIILGVTGGIAAYKAAIICSQLKQQGADVRVIMTEGAQQFVQPLTFQALSRNHVYIDTFAEHDPTLVSHIDLADHADLVLIAPATANFIGKYANGIADDMLTTTVLATEAPVWIAPAMNGHMLQHPVVQENIAKLARLGVSFLDSEEGQLACGYVGKGRLADPMWIVEQVLQFFKHGHKVNPTVIQGIHGESWQNFWQHKRVIVTAGPTQEALDPVRYLSNHSSGKMGLGLAEQLMQLGAKVTLVAGPIGIPIPETLDVVKVVSAEEMLQAVLSYLDEADVFIKSAAVADYTPVIKQEQKIKKHDDELVIHLKKTTDILATLGERCNEQQMVIGFAAETHDVEHYAKSKLTKKKADYIVANDVTHEGAGFGVETNKVTVFSKTGRSYDLPFGPKGEVAYHILRTIAEEQAEQNT